MSHLTAVPDQPGTGTLAWRRDVDPLGLPGQERFTAGQLRVLRAALSLFADQGYEGSSIRDIAAAAGIQSASLYKHFASKDAMLSALVMLGHENHLTNLMNAALNAGADPRDQLAAVVRAHVLGHCEYPRLAAVANHERRHLPAEDLPGVEALRTQAALITVEVLRRGTEQGVFDLVGAEVTLAALGSMGVAVASWFPYHPEFEAQQLADDYARLALRMVGADPEEHS